MHVLSRPEQIESPLIRALFHYWQGKRPPGGIPSRRDIDPAELRQYLPNLMIADLEQDPFRVRFRLVGTRVVEITGFEFTGRYLDEIAAPDVRQRYTECYLAASQTRQPVFERITWRFDERTTGEYDFCVLPLDDVGGVVQRALAAECYARLDKQYNLSALRQQRDGAARRLR